jgi:gas vesicle protein
MKKNDTFGFMLLAFGVGVLAGILLAPNSGNQTRKELSAKIDAFFEEASDFITYECGKIKSKFDKV